MDCPNCGMPQVIEDWAGEKLYSSRVKCGSVMNHGCEDGEHPQGIPLQVLRQSDACREIARLNERVRVLEEAINVALNEIWDKPEMCVHVHLAAALSGGKESV